MPVTFISTSEQALLEQARQLAAQLALPLIYPAPAPTEACLWLTADYLAVDAPSLGSPVYIDFTAGKLAHRRLYGGGRNQPLARAIGLKKGDIPNVMDATAGLGRDAFVLATLGCQVRMLEQNAILVALLTDALERARQNAEVAPITARMQIQQAHSVALLQTLDSADAPDVIYLDPMYPARDKSAQVKKDMQLLHQLIGPDVSGPELLAVARQRARQRVVVKRPKSAPYVDGQNPTASISSKNTRYDIYSTR